MTEKNMKLWVFGYGSLCWHPGFKYSDSQLGFIKGFKRRFWQGNNTHRGTEQKLGRVVTLIEDEDEVTWGKAFQVDDEKVSKSYLDKREIVLGGYTTILTKFEPLDKNIEPFEVLIYIALAGNDQYLGKASYAEMAMDIISSKGNAGHNLEYLANLAYFMRENLPEIQDDHLYLLEKFCIFILKNMNSSLLNYFCCHSVEEKWLQRIQLELNKQQYRLTHILEHKVSIDLSDGEESDLGESTSSFCSSDDELTNSDDLLFNANETPVHLVANNLLNNSFFNDESATSCRFYLNSKPNINENLHGETDDSDQYGKYQTNYYHRKCVKENNYSDFNNLAYSSFDYNSSNQPKWSIKGF